MSASSASSWGITPDLLPRLAGSGLHPLEIAGRKLLPIVQGGMGVGVSAHRLAGAVAALGGIGTLSSVDLRRHHPDLMARTEGLSARAGCDADTKARINDANLEALEREVKAARAAGGGLGLLAMNVMRAVSDYAAQVRRSLEAGIDMVVVGAGLPLDLPDLAADHPGKLLVPILSDARGVRCWCASGSARSGCPMPSSSSIRAGRRPPGRREDCRPERPALRLRARAARVDRVPARAGVEREVPLIAAGGIRTFEDIARVQSLGAAAVQLGTPFAVTSEECDAHDKFKRVLAEARDEDVVEFTSVAGLPARAVATPLAEPTTWKLCRGCRPWCTRRRAAPGVRLPGAVRPARRPEGWGQFCIDKQLASALRGEVNKGLFFRGVGALPFGDQIRQRARADRTAAHPRHAGAAADAGLSVAEP
jgi:nitronate monooxygenase